MNPVATMTAALSANPAVPLPAKERVELILSQVDRLPALPAVVAQLLAASTSDDFGWAVDVDGDTALVGSSDGGAATVFVRAAGVWTEQATLIASDSGASDEYGTTVALSGDFAAVGAFNDDDLGGNSGSVFVFERDGVTWTEVAKLHAEDGAGGDTFGRALAMDGATIVITPDGPRGPCYSVAEGVTALAQVTGLPIIPASSHLPWKLQLKSWDRFQIPLPFSRCSLRFGDPIWVPRDASDEEREKIRQQLESALMNITTD